MLSTGVREQPAAACGAANDSARAPMAREERRATLTRGFICTTAERRAISVFSQQNSTVFQRVHSLVIEKKIPPMALCAGL